jgi:hypothetical protein
MAAAGSWQRAKREHKDPGANAGTPHQARRCDVPIVQFERTRWLVPLAIPKQASRDSKCLVHRVAFSSWQLGRRSRVVFFRHAGRPASDATA